MAEKKAAPEKRTVTFGKNVWLRDGKVDHVGRYEEHPDLIVAGTPVDLTEEEIADITKALTPAEDSEEE
jgi:hypothetical protein